MPKSSTPTENLCNTIAGTSDDPPAIKTPSRAHNTLTPHNSVARRFLRTSSFLKTPYPNTRIVTSRQQFSPVRRKR